MLKTRLLHPEILAALGEAGHGAQVLIADGNYPLATRSNPDAYRVFLNLEPGKLTVTDVLSVIAEAIPVEAAYVMGPDDGSEPSIYEDFRGLLPDNELERLGRFEFYDMARELRLRPRHRHGRAAHLRQHPAHHRRGDARVGRQASPTPPLRP